MFKVTLKLRSFKSQINQNVQKKKLKERGEKRYKEEAPVRNSACEDCFIFMIKIQFQMNVSEIFDIILDHIT